MRCSSCSVKVKPIVSLDIDGTLGNYHKHFIEFAEQYLGRRLPFHMNYTGRERFWQYLEIDLETYRTVKLAYRQGGTKRWMPAYEHAEELVHALRMCGAEVWICTTRPFLRLDNIDPDTREWLLRNNIQYDHMVHGEEKYQQLVDLVDKGRVVAVLEDLPEQYELAESLGLLPILRLNYHNTSFQAERQFRVEYVTTLQEAENKIIERIEKWELTRMAKTSA